MKHHIFFSFVTLFAIASGVFVPPRSGHKKHHLLGAKECTWGPSYWCQNLTAAADCHAVPHCIQTVWIHKKLPPDTSSICQTCLDMVRQARDQLESNETQELIKEVFEGSCKLLHIKPVVKECDKIADNYIPELIDTLASQMNPQVVCSVAGLCNSEKIHQLLRESGEKIEVTKSTTEVAALNTCEGCHTVVELIESKFNKMSRDDLLHSFLRICGKMGSFSDGCSNIVITYFNDIYRHLQEHLNAEEVCLFSGDCSAQFHKHANVEITPMSHVGYVQPAVTKDDLPCQLCEQLVAHLRDLLIANTTEEEFKKVLEGLCKQSGKFSQECSSLVDQYYELIYSYLTHNLNGSEVCLAIGICPGQQEDYFFAPLLPVSTAKMAQKLKDDPEMARIPLQKETVKVVPPETEQDIIPEQQIPIEAVVPPHMQVLYNKEVCEFCQYFLHYMQNALADPKTEDKIKSVLEEACDHLPSVVNETCQGFVDTYEPALIAILVQDIDPSQVCPLIRACPSSKNAEVEIFMQAKGDSRCPLCLFAVTKLEDMVKDQKTEENIEKALNKICDHLPESTVDECKDFVKTYSKELIELLMADLKPDEVCVYLKMCSDEKPAPKLPPYVFRHIGGDVETNIIPDNTINGHFFDPKDVEIIEDSPQCVMCEFIMKEIEDQLKDNDQHIEQIVKNICNVMPHSVKDKCNDFVDKYADTIIQLLIQALEPSEICTMMKLCNSHMNDMKVQILDCPICEMTVEAMEKVLGNPKVDHDIEHILEKTCRGLPQRYRNKCYNIILSHGFQITNGIWKSKRTICREIGYCRLKIDHCLYGPNHWCISEENAVRCQSRAYCETKVWKRAISKRNIQHQTEDGDPCYGGPKRFCKSEQAADKCGSEARALCENHFWGTAKIRTRRSIQLNKETPCAWGPSYWCSNEEYAGKCGAMKHCQENVWGGSKSERSSTAGSNPCTWGPSHWCASEENADKCNARDHCQTNVWGDSRPRRHTQLVGDNPCTWGPSHWCASEENADKCNARAHCEKNIWGGPRPKRSAGLGSDPCTWGPSHWCASEENADKCNARAHCEQSVWGGSRPKRQTQMVGDNPCTWGPSHWCASEENADKCNARAHCEKNVWRGPRPKRSVGLGSDPCTWGSNHC